MSNHTMVIRYFKSKTVFFNMAAATTLKVVFRCLGIPVILVMN